jgi:hypothetical protein
VRTWLVSVVIVAACRPAGQSAATAAGDTSAATLPAAVDSAAIAAPPGSGETGGAMRSSAPTREGKIIVSGSEGMLVTTLQTAAGVVFLTGVLENELRTLSGATVRVSGTETKSGSRTTVDVQSYEIVAVDGERPVVGTLLSGNRLAVGSDTLTVTGAFTAPVGAKMWVTGARSGKQIAVRSYGIITRP